MMINDYSSDISSNLKTTFILVAAVVAPPFINKRLSPCVNISGRIINRYMIFRSGSSKRKHFLFIRSYEIGKFKIKKQYEFALIKKNNMGTSYENNNAMGM